MMPCLPAYGGYDHHWLKAVRRQQKAFAAVYIPEPLTAEFNELSGGIDAQQTAHCNAGTASALSASTEGSLVAQALGITRQHGMSAVELGSLLPSMPRSKAEKQVNRQALATVSIQLDPANTQLQCSAHEQQMPKAQSTSPNDHARPCVNSEPLLPVSLDKETRQQLIYFCSVGSISPLCSTQQPPMKPAVELADNAVQVHGRPQTDCLEIQSCFLLEEPVFDNSAELMGPMCTAAAEVIGNPLAPSAQASKVHIKCFTSALVLAHAGSMLVQLAASGTHRGRGLQLELSNVHFTDRTCSQQRAQFLTSWAEYCFLCYLQVLSGKCTLLIQQQQLFAGYASFG